VKQKFLGVGDTVITKQQISSNGRGNNIGDDCIAMTALNSEF
jgi:hypothetical protein